MRSIDRIATWMIAGALAYPSAAEAADFRFTNPNFGINVRDCQIVREGGTYYLTGTFPPFGRGVSPGVRISQSTDLVHWSEPAVIVPPNPKGWYQILFWAPEIFPLGEKFYATFNCPGDGSNLFNIPHLKNWQQMVGLAVADSIAGPYRVVTTGQPLTDGNDATLFLDSDGRVYVYRAVSPSGIACVEVDLGTGRVIGESTSCISPGAVADWDGGSNVGIEGPSVFKRNGVYYLTYSSWRRGYEVGYATAPNPRGPWIKYAGNPIYGAQDPDWCRRFHGNYTQTPDVPFGQVGHGSPFFGPDGRIWFCCHGIEQRGRGPDTEPHLVITPMVFRDDGSIQMTLTWTPQSVPVPAPNREPLWRYYGTPASVGEKAATEEPSEREIAQVTEFIRAAFPKTLRSQPQDAGDMVSVPFPYNVPSIAKYYKELYYWDTYFINVGLIQLGWKDQAINNFEDLASLVGRMGYVPNANRRQGLNRSQMPFLAPMLEDLVDDRTDPKWLGRAYAAVGKEYDFWMAERRAPNGLNSPHNSADEIYLRHFYTYLASHRFRGMKLPSPEDELRFSSQALSEAETGWDFTPRFDRQAENWCPVDMNSNLYLYEMILARISRRLGDGDEQLWLRRAESRRRLIQQYLWNEQLGCYVDYDYVHQEKGTLISCAALSPLFAGIATPGQAASVVGKMREVLEYDHGLAACENRPEPFVYQWDYPNAWAPLQYIAIRGLERYGYHTDARRIARKYLGVVTANFERTGDLWEKYNAVTGGSDTREENSYPMPDIVDFTAGVFVYCANNYR